MPNHIENRLEIIGTPEQVNEVREFLKGKPFDDGTERLIDFNKIVKMPEELMIDESSIGDIGEGVLFGTGGMMFLHKEEVDRRFLDLDYELRLQAIELGLKYKSNFEKYGANNWYDWCRKNWGTKWNAYSIKAESDNVLFFQTAWNSVANLIIKLSEKFPNVKFSYKWSDEDAGNNCGYADIEKGVSDIVWLENGSDEAYEMYFELHPEHKDDYELVDGKWKYKED